MRIYHYPLFAFFDGPQDFRPILKAAFKEFAPWAEAEVHAAAKIPTREEKFDKIAKPPDVLKHSGDLDKIPQIVYHVEHIRVDAGIFLEWGNLAGKKPSFIWIEYRGPIEEDLQESGLSPKELARLQEETLHRFLHMLIRDCGAGLAYISWLNTKTFLEHERFSPFKQADRVQQLYARAEGLLESLIEAEEINFLWMLALPVERYGAEYQRYAKRLTKDYDLVLVRRTEDMILLQQFPSHPHLNTLPTDWLHQL